MQCICNSIVPTDQCLTRAPQCINVGNPTDNPDCSYVAGKALLSTRFLAVQNSSIGDLVTHQLTHFTDWYTKSNPRDLWPLRHLIGVIRRHELTKKKTMTKTKTETKTMTKTNTFREHLQRATLDTFDLWDIWSEQWRDMTWPKKDIDKGKDKHNDNDNDKYI